MPMADALISRPVWEGEDIAAPNAGKGTGFGFDAAMNMSNAINSPMGMIGRGVVPGFGVLGGLGSMAANQTVADMLGVDTQFGGLGFFGPGNAVSAVNQVGGLTGEDFAGPGGGQSPSIAGINTRGHDDRGSPRGESDNGGDFGGFSGDFGGDGGTASSSGTGTGPGVGGYYNGGMVTPDRMVGPDPSGPDEGYIPVQAGEYVTDKKTTKKYGKKHMKMMQALTK